MIPYWLKGGILGTVYVLIVFLIKATCVPDWCFADIFLPTILNPLALLDYLLNNQQIILIGENLLLSASVLWFFIGSFLGLIYTLVRKERNNKPIELNLD